MKIAVKNVDPWTVLELDGALDAEAGPGVYLQFQRVLSRGQTHFLFDLDRVDLVDPQQSINQLGQLLSKANLLKLGRIGIGLGRCGVDRVAVRRGVGHSGSTCRVCPRS